MAEYISRSTKNFFDLLTDMEVELRPISKAPGYFAGSDGAVYSTLGRGWAHRKPGPNALRRKATRLSSSGYPLVKLVIGQPGARYVKTFILHRLICESWHGLPAKPTMEVEHLNSRKTDCRPANLIWATTHKNFKHKIAHDKRMKLYPAKVKEMRELMMIGVPLSQVAAVYNVSYHTVYYIAQCVTWRRQGCGITAEFRRWQQHLGRQQEPELETVNRLRKKANDS